MKLVLLILALTVSSSLAENFFKTEWRAFKEKHSKAYRNTAEELTRFSIWKSNLDYVTRHNEEAKSGKHSFWLEMNQFADLTNKEFVQLYNGYNATMKKTSSEQVFTFNPSLEVPESIDWRTLGYVSEVKNQGQCGSCWAFSATGALEGQHFRATGKLVSLSEQNLVDCSRKYGNEGCNGGLMDQAFTYIQENNGIDTEESYPYTAKDSECKFKPENVGATDNGFVDIKSKDEDALKQALGTLGPISVAIDASHISFQLYSHGIYHEMLCSQTRLDHGVLAVGYGSEGGKDFWIVKNSWGPKWGDAGYIRMSRNRKNNCGVATAPSYPVV